MSETVNQENTTAVQPEEPKTFTQAEMDAIIGDRLKRERLKYADCEELKQKAEKFDASEEASKSELQKATERAEALQKELDSYKHAEEVRQIRTKVSAETGVPVELINGDTEEICKVQAEKLKPYIDHGYPRVRDAGEPRKTAPGSTREQFANWFETSLKKQ
jgi:hypothetical protein